MDISRLTAQLHKSMAQPAAGFKAGQILSARILKIFPNQHAEVQIGSRRLIAALDAPLAAGERYWLQVQPGDGKIRLKVLDTEGGAKAKAGVEQILPSLGIAVNKDSVSLADYLLKNGLPLTKETMLELLSWLPRDGKEQALPTIKTMLEHGLPAVRDVFLALQSMEEGEPLAAIISSLKNELEQKELPADLKSRLIHLLSRTQQPTAGSAALAKLLEVWAGSEPATAAREGTESLLQRAGVIQNNEEAGAGLGRLLMEAGSRAGGLPQELKTGLGLIEQYILRIKSGSRTEAEKILSVLQQAPGQEALNSNVKLQSPFLLAGKLAEAFIQANGAKDLAPILNMSEWQAAQSDIVPVLQQASGRTGVSEAEAAAASKVLQLIGPSVDFADGAFVAPYLKDTIRMLGLNMEHVLASSPGKAEAEQELAGLKPLLMQLLNEPGADSAVREKAESLLYRITAQQLLSSDTGPIQQMYMQLPLSPPFHTDLTIEWQGRRTKDGQIDPGYCRILFYLDLESLKETVIDMQIQNRVIKAVIYNEQHELLAAASQPLIKQLKGNLENHQYQLSGVSFEAERKKAVPAVEGSAVHTDYNGLDIRI